MTERRDPKKSAGFGDDSNLELPRTAAKVSDTLPVSARITRELFEELQSLAQDQGVSLSSLMGYGLAYFLKRYKADPTILKYETRKVLKGG